MSIYVYDLYYTFTEVFLLLNVLIFILFSVIYGMKKNWGFPIFNLNLGWISVYTIFLSILLLWNSNYYSIQLFNTLLINDILTYSSKMLLLFWILVWILFTRLYIQIDKINFLELWILIFLALLAMLILLSSLNLLTFYLGIELQSLIFYILASLQRGTEFSMEASLKYFILSSISSVILLLGLTLIYAFSGLTNLLDFNIFYKTLNLYENNIISEGIFLGLLLLLITFAFKIGIAPFHIWILDIYEASPTNITAFFAIITKYIYFILFSRIFVYYCQSFINFWYHLIILCIFLSVIIGTTGALMQYKWKRFLAYSSINHIGFLIIPFLIPTLKSVETLLFYLYTYLIMTITIFSCFFCLYNYSKKSNLRYLSDLQMLLKVNPYLALIFIITLFSISGIPPFIGFFSKMYIFSILIKNNFLGIAIFTAISSCFSAIYYLRIIKTMYFSISYNWIFLKKNYFEQGLPLIFSITYISFFYLDANLLLLPLKFITTYFNFY